MGGIGIAVSAIALSACDGVVRTAQDDAEANGEVLQAYDLRMEFIYDGREYSESVKFECWHVEHAFSSDLSVIPSRHAVVSLPDGSALAFVTAGMCHLLAADAARDSSDFTVGGRMATAGSVEFPVLRSPHAVSAPPTLWLSDPVQPLVIDTYLTGGDMTSPASRYRWKSSTVLPADAAAAPADLEERAGRLAPFLKVNPPSIYCGGVVVTGGPTSERDLISETDDDLTVPARARRSGLARVVAPATSISGVTSEYRRLSRAARPILFRNGSWTADENSSGLLRQYRVNAIEIPRSFHFGGDTIPFRTGFNTYRVGSRAIHTSIYCPREITERDHE